MVFEETEQRGRQQMRIKKIRDEETWEDASDEELQAALQKAVEHEEYEQASLIRDELKKRKEAKS
jgi:protein-arginine kinase activator protein McsA